jgi:hypothetical protein
LPVPVRPRIFDPENRGKYDALSFRTGRSGGFVKSDRGFDSPSAEQDQRPAAAWLESRQRQRPQSQPADVKAGFAQFKYYQQGLQMMMKTIRFILAVTIGLATAPGTTSAQAVKVPQRQELAARAIAPLNGAQLAALLTNNTLYHVVPGNGVRVPLLYLPDGTRFVRIRGQQTKTTWRIERDMVCEESVVLKREVCRSLFRADGIGAICDEGSATCDFGLDWAAGNPEKLGQ